MKRLRRFFGTARRPRSGGTTGAVAAPRLAPAARRVGRRLVTADIHGCAETFRALCDRVGPGGGDHLYILGDAIAKGPDSRGVLETMLELRRSGVSVTYVRGNHEQSVLRAAARSPGKLRATLERAGLGGVLEGDELSAPYRALLESTVWYVELPDALLVHAGFDFTATDPFAPSPLMAEIRDWAYDGARAEGRRVFHGHVRVPLHAILERLCSGARVIPLDNGASVRERREPYRLSEFGNLLCYDLDSGDLTVQPAIDAPAPSVACPATFACSVPS